MTEVATRTGSWRIVDGERAMRAWLVASLICNMGIIVSGAVVRVTGSGLGCDTWPQCHEGTYVPHGASGIHSYIEFGNRLLTFVLIIAALGAFVSVWRNRGRGGRLWWLTLGIGLGIPFQGVIGGISVLLRLNPWAVALHLLLSVALVVLCTWSVRLGYDLEPEPVGPRGRQLAVLTFGFSMLAIWLGTVVTGAGPHAGDLRAVRNGLDITSIARVHSLSAWATTFLTIACTWWYRRTGHPRAARAAWILLATLAAQVVIGYVQYFLGLPTPVVVLHLIGLAAVNVAAAWLLFATTSAASDTASVTGSRQLTR